MVQGIGKRWKYFSLSDDISEFSQFWVNLSPTHWKLLTHLSEIAIPQWPSGSGLHPHFWPHILKPLPWFWLCVQTLELHVLSCPAFIYQCSFLYFLSSVWLVWRPYLITTRAWDDRQGRINSYYYSW